MFNGTLNVFIDISWRCLKTLITIVSVVKRISWDKIRISDLAYFSQH